MPRTLLIALALASLPFAAAAEEATQVVPVKGNISMIVSPMGGNVVVSSGEDGIFIIDDQLAARSAEVNAAIKGISDQPVKFIVNTHYHFDHTGGNEFFGGEGAVIVAHDNVRERLSTQQFITFFNKEMPPLSKAGLPVVTFGSEVTFHYNGDAIHIVHVDNAHTDGDAVAHFETTNVIVAGDTIFNGMYPFIDTEHGGSIKGVLAALDKIVAMADAETIIVPGHGPLMKQQDVQAYKTTLAAITSAVEACVEAKKTLEQCTAEKPTQTFDDAMGGGIVKADAFVKLVFDDLSR